MAVLVITIPSFINYLLPFTYTATTGNDITSVLPGVNQSFPSDVESEANSYFQKIYNQPPNPTMTIDEVLEMLKNFKDSPSKKEKVFGEFYNNTRTLLLRFCEGERQCFENVSTYTYMYTVLSVFFIQ